MRLLFVALLLAGCVDSTGRTPDDPPPMTGSDPTAPDANPLPPEHPDEVIARWQACMTLADFQATHMASVWATLPATSNQKCMSCHVNGGNGFIATTDDKQMFDVLQTNKYYWLELFTVAPTGQGSYKVVVNEQTVPATGTGQVPHAEHPRFDATAGMNATRSFYELTEMHCAAPI